MVLGLSVEMEKPYADSCDDDVAGAYGGRQCDGGRTVRAGAPPKCLKAEINPVTGHVLCARRTGRAAAH